MPNSNIFMLTNGKTPEVDEKIQFKNALKQSNTQKAFQILQQHHDSPAMMNVLLKVLKPTESKVKKQGQQDVIYYIPNIGSSEANEVLKVRGTIKSFDIDSYEYQIQPKYIGGRVTNVKPQHVVRISFFLSATQCLSLCQIFRQSEHHCQTPIYSVLCLSNSVQNPNRRQGCGLQVSRTIRRSIRPRVGI